MRFLITGFGNIGQRYFRNIKEILPESSIDVCCSKKEEYRIFDNNLNITFSDSPLDIYPINNFYHDLREALITKYDAVFVCSLPPERIEIAIQCAEEGNNIFIEKPLSHNLDKVCELQGIIEENKIKSGLGFQMRFHPILNKLKEMVDSNEFGNIYRIEVNHCNSIYNWSQGRNLANFYPLKENQGGGVLFSQIHEIDYLTWVFGYHYPVSAIYGKWLNINSDVEDNITILSNLELNNNCVPIIINLDFLSKIPTRKITVYGTEKVETFDLLPKNSDEWNNLFLTEMKAFINLLDGKKDDRLATLEDGIRSLEYCGDIIR